MRKKSRKLEPEEIKRQLDALSDESDAELEKSSVLSEKIERKSDQTERKSDQTERKSDQTERLFDQTERISDQTYLDEPLNVDTVVHEGSEQDLNLEEPVNDDTVVEEGAEQDYTINSLLGLTVDPRNMTQELPMKHGLSVYPTRSFYSEMIELDNLQPSKKVCWF